MSFGSKEYSTVWLAYVRATANLTTRFLACNLLNETNTIFTTVARGWYLQRTFTGIYLLTSGISRNSNVSMISGQRFEYHMPLSFRNTLAWVWYQRCSSTSTEDLFFECCLIPKEVRLLTANVISYNCLMSLVSIVCLWSWQLTTTIVDFRPSGRPPWQICNILSHNQSSSFTTQT